MVNGILIFGCLPILFPGLVAHFEQQSLVQQTAHSAAMLLFFRLRFALLPFTTKTVSMRLSPFRSPFALCKTAVQSH